MFLPTTVVGPVIKDYNAQMLAVQNVAKTWNTMIFTYSYKKDMRYETTLK